MSLKVIHQFQGYSNASHLHLYSAAIYKISTGTPASRGPSATAGLLVFFTQLALSVVKLSDYVHDTEHRHSFIAITESYYCRWDVIPNRCANFVTLFLLCVTGIYFNRRVKYRNCGLRRKCSTSYYSTLTVCFKSGMSFRVTRVTVFLFDVLVIYIYTLETF